MAGHNLSCSALVFMSLQTPDAFPSLVRRSGSGSHENGCPFKVITIEKEVQTRIMHEQEFGERECFANKERRLCIVRIRRDTTLPLACSATIFLLSVESSSVSRQFFASAMRTLDSDRYHVTFHLSEDFSSYFILHSLFDHYQPYPAARSNSAPLHQL